MPANISYDTCFTPYIKQFTCLRLNDAHLSKLVSSISTLIKRDELKLNRKLNQDEANRYKKIYMQVAGDVVLEQHLGATFVNYKEIERIPKPYVNNIIGDGNIDVCTFSYGVFPLVYAKTYRKTLFVCMKSKSEFYICGIGTPAVINSYSSRDLVMIDSLRDSGKSGFYGFYNLTPVSPNIRSFLKTVSK